MAEIVVEVISKIEREEKNYEVNVALLTTRDVENVEVGKILDEIAKEMLQGVN